MRPAGPRSVGRALSLEEAVADAVAVGIPAEPADPATRGERDSSDLTPRECEVLRLLAAGKTDREIARVLFIAERTAEDHARKISAKLGVANRAEAAAVAVGDGLV